MFDAYKIVTSVTNGSQIENLVANILSKAFHTAQIVIYVRDRSVVTHALTKAMAC